MQVILQLHPSGVAKLFSSEIKTSEYSLKQQH